MSLHRAAETGDAEALRQLLAQGMDANERDPTGKTALHWARDETVARLLIEAGADVNARNDAGYTPAHSAARNGRAGVMDLLIEAGAEVNAASHDQAWTPLHAAVDDGREPIVQKLIAAGAHVNATDRTGMTPLAIAMERGYAPLAAMLSDAGGVDGMQPF